MGSKKRKFADDGWALWIDGDDRSTIYLNEWINPKGRSYVDISVRVYGAKETKELIGYIATHHDNLSATLDEKQKDILQRFDDCWSELSEINEREIFVYAFRLGARIAIEVMSLDIE